ESVGHPGGALHLPSGGSRHRLERVHLPLVAVALLDEPVGAQDEGASCEEPAERVGLTADTSEGPFQHAGVVACPAQTTGGPAAAGSEAVKPRRRRLRSRAEEVDLSRGALAGAVEG